MNSNETVNTNNINSANFELKLESIEFKGITLKGLSMSARADFSDEKVKMETEGAVSILKALFSFADAKLDRVIEHAVEADNRRFELRQKEFERETELRKARVESEHAHRDFWKARTAEILAAMKSDDASAAEDEAMKGEDVEK